MKTFKKKEWKKERKKDTGWVGFTFLSFLGSI